MLILATDVGTGTQDILLFNSEKEVENSLLMVMPAPTQIIAKKKYGKQPKRERQ
ncbi:hypothetical protein [Methanosarcina barkeri]|uniref:hypothetical protein n=1 Tax=Methanosarcina barkeri TaxID=2208 RepID=UPI000AFC0A50|nr:hypothetical protein [Methanosarcina barkeri]